MNLSEFEYIDNFYCIISSCCEAVQIYYNGDSPLRTNESQEHNFSNCGDRSGSSYDCSSIPYTTTSISTLRTPQPLQQQRRR